uniref:type I phosphomannose isomerase catalytic subunit n=1 Tax=Alistipes putredinis TaxID=28117 RepID=UPI003FD88C04
MRPLKFHPILKQTLWGGERIIPYKELASELSRVGESWELSGMPGSESVVAEGPWTGSTLPELIGRFGAELLGKANYARFGQEFPLLVKFIDAREDLSIQVHPDDELARKRHGKSGKCEMWYVLEAEPGASLLTGFSRPIAPAEYERRVADNTLTDVLNRQAIASGDVFYLPAGRVHSIGKGSFIVEIQQSSDITYRIYDFDRRDAAGNSRELHTELAREAIDFESSENSRITYAPENNQEVRLVTTPYFTTSLYTLTARTHCDWSATDSFVAIVLLQGSGSLTDNEGNRIDVRQGETWLLPASTQWTEITPHTAPLRLLTSRI